ncbi:MAG: GspH/FimT family pseudopilin [Acidiferrobacterales bacterium]|nr:GspH/FimT family pseudopilin [Acidiferrobacterales bacterium]
MAVLRQYRNRRDRRAGRGFSLIELLFVLFVIGILAAIAFPTYQRYVAATRLAGHAQFIVETLRLARFEVFTRKVTVSLCASSNAADCTGSAWEKGWIVFTDDNTPGTVDADDEVLRAVAAYNDGITIDVTDGNKDLDYIQLRPDSIQLSDCTDCPATPVPTPHWSGEILLALLGINDAMAYRAGCSDENSSNSPSSENCKKPLAVLKLCDSLVSGEYGQSVTLLPNGMTPVTNIRCD